MKLISRLLRISERGLGTIMTMGIIAGICAFEKVDGMSQAKLTYYCQTTPEQIYQSTIVPSWHLYWIGFEYLVSYCLGGIVIMIVAIELIIRTCGLFNWKNNIFYKFLANDSKR